MKKLSSKIKKQIKQAALISLQALGLAVLTLLAVFPFSCKATAEGIEIVGADYTSPTLNEVSVTSENTVLLTFSEAVKLKGLAVTFTPIPLPDETCTDELSTALQILTGEESGVASNFSYSDDSKKINLSFENQLEIGQTYSAYGQIEDKIGSTLTFAAGFTGYNAHIPKLIITEIHPKYTKSTNKSGTTYKNEFVEILALSDGNTAGLYLVSGYDGEDKRFTFPAVEVKAGDILILHLRTLGEECVSELEDDLTLSKAKYSSDNARDLWDENDSARLGDEIDIILIKSSQDNSVLDAVAYRNPQKDSWPKDFMATLAEQAVNAGILKSSEISAGFDSTGITPSKTFIRTNAKSLLEQALADEDFEYPVPFASDEWILSGTSAETPGTI